MSRVVQVVLPPGLSVSLIFSIAVFLLVYADLAVGLIASDARPDLIFLERTRRRCDDDGDDVVFDIFRLLLPNVSDGSAKSDDRNESQESILFTDSESDSLSLLSHSITGKALTLLLLKVVLSLKVRPKNSQEREESTLLPILTASLVLYCSSSNACVAGDEIVGTIFAYSLFGFDLILLLVMLVVWFSFRVCVRSNVTLCRSCVMKEKKKNYPLNDAFAS
jgi:hypothetical protein